MEYEKKKKIYHGHVLSSKVFADANKGYLVPPSLVDLVKRSYPVDKFLVSTGFGRGC